MSEHKNYIEHEGIVIKTTTSQVDVQIIVKSGCAGCHVKGACNLSDMEEKVIEVKNPPNEFKIGEKVLVGMESAMGYKALFLGYLFPFIIILLTLNGGKSVFQEEGIAAGVTLAFTALYYMVIYFFKDHLKKVFRYRINKTSYL